MMRRSLVVLALMTLAPVIDGRERLEIRARPAFSFAPAEVQLEFRITPDSRNWMLSVVTWLIVVVTLYPVLLPMTALAS